MNISMLIPGKLYITLRYITPYFYIQEKWKTLKRDSIVMFLKEEEPRLYYFTCVDRWFRMAITENYNPIHEILKPIS